MTTRITCTMTSAKLKARISAVKKRVATNQDHETLVECARHAYVHGDTSYLKNMIVALLGPSGRKIAGTKAISWAQKYFPVTVTKLDNGAITVTLKAERAEADWKFDEAKHNVFDEGTEKELDLALLGPEYLVQMIHKITTSKKASPELIEAAKKAEVFVTSDLGLVSEEAA